jgi:hypothetical protein
MHFFRPGYSYLAFVFFEPRFFIDAIHPRSAGLGASSAKPGLLARAAPAFVSASGKAASSAAPKAAAVITLIDIVPTLYPFNQYAPTRHFRGPRNPLIATTLHAAAGGLCEGRWDGLGEGAAH